MKKSLLFISGIILLTFAVSGYFYPSMPERVASHWDASGQVNGYMGRFWGLFLVPFISLGISLLFWAVLKIDPLKGNIEKAGKRFIVFLVSLLVFLLYIHLLTIFWNLGYRFNLTQWMSPVMGAIFCAGGILLGKIKRNYSVGIRTPWTLASDQVWDKTHRLGGRLFIVSGLLALLGAVWPNKAIFFILIPILAASAVSIAYSYLLYRQKVKDLK
jgi:uncharacterized membrane protein